MVPPSLDRPPPLLRLFSGCISVADLSHNALKYNEAVEQAQNRMLFLNVVRAERFRPMYITDLAKITRQHQAGPQQRWP